jgi:hypothetical protein
MVAELEPLAGLNRSGIYAISVPCVKAPKIMKIRKAKDLPQESTNISRATRSVRQCVFFERVKRRAIANENKACFRRTVLSNFQQAEKKRPTLTPRLMSKNIKHAE